MWGFSTDGAHVSPDVLMRPRTQVKLNLLTSSSIHRNACRDILTNQALHIRFYNYSDKDSFSCGKQKKTENSIKISDLCFYHQFEFLLLGDSQSLFAEPLLVIIILLLR